MSPRSVFLVASIALIAAVAAAAAKWPGAAYAFVLVGPLVGLGVYDMVQTKHAIRRNFPLIGHGRYILESIRPEINQYFIESNMDGVPFNRERRSVVYELFASLLTGDGP